MSDAVIIAIAAGILSFLGVLVNGLVAVNVARLTTANNRNAEAAAVEVSAVKVQAEEAATIVKQVKTNLADNTKNVDKKLDVIHTLVNSNFGVQLRIAAVALRRVAALTKEPEDAAAADLAESAFNDHEAQQAQVARANV